MSEHETVALSEIYGENGKWANLLESLGFKGIRVLSVTENPSGRWVHLDLPRDGTVTLEDLHPATRRIEVMLRMRPGGARFRTLTHAADVQLELNERQR
jgi:hypothetical protein